IPVQKTIYLHSSYRQREPFWGHNNHMEQRRGHLKKDAPFIFEFPRPIKHACPNQHYSVILGKMEKLSPQLLQTKQHFDVLDGLRGIAALAIVVFHFMEWIYTDPTQNFIGHGF